MKLLVFINTVVLLTIVWDLYVKHRFRWYKEWVNTVGKYPRLTLEYKYNITDYGWSTYNLITMPMFWKPRVR